MVMFQNVTKAEDISIKGYNQNSYKKFDAYGAVAYFLDTIIDGLSWRVYEKQCRIKEENKQKEK